VRATINLKGLYEFAHGFTQLSELALHQLSSRTERHIRVTASLDLWIAAAQDLFHMPVRAPFEVHDDALQIWRRMKQSGNLQDESKKYPGLRDTLALASSANRLRRTGFADSRSGRMRAQATIISSILHPKFITARAPRIV
jgi:hypothetical protein